MNTSSFFLSPSQRRHLWVGVVRRGRLGFGSSSSSSSSCWPPDLLAPVPSERGTLGHSRWPPPPPLPPPPRPSMQGDCGRHVCHCAHTNIQLHPTHLHSGTWCTPLPNATNNFPRRTVHCLSLYDTGKDRWTKHVFRYEIIFGPIKWHFYSFPSCYDVPPT